MWKVHGNAHDRRPIKEQAKIDAMKAEIAS
jgi:hypothetical protein